MNIFTSKQAKAAVLLCALALAGGLLRLKTAGRSQVDLPSFGPRDSTVASALKSRLEQLTEPININTADQDLLTLLPGIGPVLAERIVTERETRGPYRDSQDLSRRVAGLGPSTIQRLERRITFSDTSARSGK